MTEVREIQPEDFESLLAMAEAMHAESNELNELTFSRDKALATMVAVFETYRETINGWVLVEDGQIIGALFASCTDTFYSNDLVASDLVVYIRPEHRGSRAVIKMIRAYEAWSKARGAKITYLGISTGIDPDRSQRLFERLGYKAIGPILKKQ